MKSRNITELGVLLSLSIVLAYIETLFPVAVAVPGVKLGLANVATIVVLYKHGGGKAFLFMLVRVLMTGVLFSGMAGILYGVAGGIISIGIMNAVRRNKKFSTIGVSISGGIAHNLGQIMIAYFLMEKTTIFYYFPVLVCSGTVAGMVVGYFSFVVYKTIEKMM